MLSEFEQARFKRLCNDIRDLTDHEIDDDELLSCPTCGSYEFNLKPAEINCSICGESVDPNAAID